MPAKTERDPYYRHYTIDPEHPVEEDAPPAQGIVGGDSDVVVEKSQEAAEGFKQRREDQRKEDEKRAKDTDRPKPSELLADQQGAGTTEEKKSSRSKKD